MDIEKVVNSKWYKGFDWLYRLLFLNLFIILIPIIFGGGPFLYWSYHKESSGYLIILSFTLILIAFIPCYITSFIIIKIFNDDRSGNIFKLYFIYLWDTIKRTYKLELILIVIAIFFSLSASYYWQLLSPSNFTGFDLIGTTSILGFVVLFFSVTMILLGFINLPMIVAYFRMNTINYIKLAFYMSFKYFFKTLFYIFLMSLPLILLYYMGNFFLPIYLLYGISFPQYIIYLISRELYWYLSNNLDDIKEENNYDYKGEENENRN